MSVSYGECAAHRLSCHVLAYSQKTSQGKATSHSLLEGSQMSGKAAAVGLVYV